MQSNSLILSASKSITIHSLQSETSYPIGEYNPHRGIVNCAVYNHTGKVIASCGQDGKILLHSAQKCQDRLLQLTYYSGQQEPSSINCCLFSPKSKYIAAGSVNTTVKIWDMKTSKQKQPVRKLKGHSGAVTSIGWLNNQQTIASASTSGDILLHDIATGAIRDSFSIKQGINNIKASEGQGYKRISACTNEGSIMVWDVNISSKKPIYTYEDSRKNAFTCISISSFLSNFMACSSVESNIIFLDINDRSRFIKLIYTQEPITSIAFNDEAYMLAAGGMNGKLLVYDLRKMPQPLSTKLSGHDTAIKSVCFGQKQKQKLKVKQYGVSSNITNTSKISNNIKQTTQTNIIEGGNDTKVKNLTTNISSNKLLVEQQKNNPRIRNLAKKQQIPNQTVTLKDRPSTQSTNLVYKSNLNVVQASTVTQQPASTNNINPTQTTSTNFQRTHASYQPTQASQSSQEIISQPHLKTIEEKLMGEMKNMEMRMNQKFQALHLQLIRQMQLSVEKIGINFEKKFSHQRQLQNKIKQLQQQNENLKKKTY